MNDPLEVNDADITADAADASAPADWVAFALEVSAKAELKDGDDDDDDDGDGDDDDDNDAEEDDPPMTAVVALAMIEAIGTESVALPTIEPIPALGDMDADADALAVVLVLELELKAELAAEADAVELSAGPNRPEMTLASDCTLLSALSVEDDDDSAGAEPGTELAPAVTVAFLADADDDADDDAEADRELASELSEAEADAREAIDEDRLDEDEDDDDVDSAAEVGVGRSPARALKIPPYWLSDEVADELPDEASVAVPALAGEVVVAEAEADASEAEVPDSFNPVAVSVELADPEADESVPNPPRRAERSPPPVDELAASEDELVRDAVPEPVAVARESSAELTAAEAEAESAVASAEDDSESEANEDAFVVADDEDVERATVVREDDDELRSVELEDRDRVRVREREDVVVVLPPSVVSESACKAVAADDEVNVWERERDRREADEVVLDEAEVEVSPAEVEMGKLPLMWSRLNTANDDCTVVGQYSAGADN